MPVTTDDDVLHGFPRLDGTRIGVLHVYDLVISGDSEPPAVADALDITLGEVHEALAYYYNHPAEMRQYREHEAESLAQLEERAVKPPVEADSVR